MNMDSSEKYDYKRPPWSGQSVKKWIRVLAWIWVILLALLGPVLIWLLVIDGIPKEDIMSVAGIVAGELYMTLLFAHVAFRGRAPKGWIPWDSSRDVNN